MQKYLKNLLFIIILGFTLSACNKLETYDDRPIIISNSYSLLKSDTGKDTTLLLTFTYTDGDGNVGLSESDTMPPYNANVMIDYFEKIDGKFTKILIPGTTDTLNFNSRIKKFGSGNPTKAEVTVNVNIAILLADTVKFEYYLLDKKLNKSNTVSTGSIALTQ